MGERVTGAGEEAFWQLASRTKSLRGHGGGSVFYLLLSFLMKPRRNSWHTPACAREGQVGPHRSAAEAIFKMDVKMTRKRSGKRRHVVSRSLSAVWNHGRALAPFRFQQLRHKYNNVCVALMLRCCHVVLFKLSLIMTSKGTSKMNVFLKID